MNSKKLFVLLIITQLVAFGVFSQDKVFTEYKVKEFSFKGHDAKVVYPNKKEGHNYWIWRARFWGHEPQVDKALLEKGFHVVYIDVANLFGNSEAVELWNEFYEYCTNKEKLNSKVVLEGMSRGGLIVYNWASENTDKVFSIYADAPVCDIKSWPGGMFNGKGSLKAWDACLKAYKLDSISVKEFENSPINNSVNIAKAGIPVLHVYGDVDTVVPYEENTALLAEKFKKAGGVIELIKKEGVGHHPHSLKDPKPIVDFILNSINDTSQNKITVNSLQELIPYLNDSNVTVKLKPGVYTITAADVAKGLYQQEVKLKNNRKVLLLFEGNNCIYDFTDVVLKIDTKVFQAYGHVQISELQIVGNNNVLKNLTMVDDGSVYDHPSYRATNIIMDGAYNRIEGFNVTTKGSFPYGYGDAFGKGGKTVIKHQKHSACLIRGESNHLKDSKFTHRSYGHCIFMQAANNPLIEGCTVEGEVRKTDDMLAETSGPAFDVGFMTVWGYKLPAGYMLSTGEAGIRAYDGGETIIDGKFYKRGTSNVTVKNCTIKYMRTGVTIAHATGKKYVEGCVAIGCENGFSLGSGEVVNCSADCAYGPVYASTYERDKKYNADITILPASDPYYNGSGTVAYIGGSGHNITLRSADKNIGEGLSIKVGGEKDNIRLLHGNLPDQNNFKVSDFQLNNLTNYPVLLSDKSTNVNVTSIGKVTDLGKENKIKKVTE